MTLAVTAATGQLGRLVVETLKAKAAAGEIVALVRNPDKATGLGVAVRQADYGRPETLGPALAGVDVLLLISGSEVGQRVPQHTNVIEAAKAAGVKRIAYTSILHCDTSPIGLADEHRGTEAVLKASGVPYTLLRNSWYNENYVGRVAGAVAAGVLIGDAGEGRIASATRQDYAEAAVAALTGQGHENQTYELAGDTAWTLSDLAAEISRRTGRDIPYKNLSQADYAEALKGVGLPEGLAQAVASWEAAIATGALFDDSHTLSRLIGRPTTPISETVAAALAG